MRPLEYEPNFRLILTPADAAYLLGCGIVRFLVCRYDLALLSDL